MTKAEVMKLAEFGCEDGFEGLWKRGAMVENNRLRPLIEALAESNEKLVECLSWYASHDPELTSEYSIAGLYKNAQTALADHAERMKAILSNSSLNGNNS